MTINEVADWVSIVGFPMAVVGLALALGQLRRTQNAVEAAEEARARTERDAALRQLLVLLPGLIEIERGLDDAVADGDHAGARRELVTWRSRGGDVQGMISGRMDLPESLHADLQRAMVQAGASKERLLDEDIDIINATESARKEISRSVISLSDLVGRLKAYRIEEGQER